MNASDILVERLVAWGVDNIFDLPGDGINGVMEDLRKVEKKIHFIHVRHEEAAAFMACGYAKFTGRLGVCLATSGPGGIPVPYRLCRAGESRWRRWCAHRRSTDRWRKV